ncbi:hypothetical protein [Clostridium sp.]|uniref:hypothetical protein n=1 Tax=Clostridium sp. TaxID=1506 RepID=UPI00261B747C|nr:hypothetical protein [Clostridium sp.]
MKFKITDFNIDGYNTEFKIRRMNYSQVVIDYPDNKGIRTIKMECGELIPEGEVDEVIKKHKDLLKIKIQRGISALFYKDLVNELEESFKEVKNIKVLNDFSRSANKRGVWDKNILLYLNNSYPLKIEASGRNFIEESYKFSINVIDKPEFLEICYFNMKKLSEQVAWREKQIEDYKKIVIMIENKSNFEKNKEI